MMTFFDNPFHKSAALSALSIITLTASMAVSPLAFADTENPQPNTLGTPPVSVSGMGRSPFVFSVLLDDIPPVTHTITTNQLCSTSADGLITLTNGALVIDLEKTPNDTNTVTINSDAADSCKNSLKTITITNAATHPITTLNIGKYAFYQTAGGSNALTTVTFPESMTTLTIGSDAFYQNAGGSNALTTVTFPESLTTLTIGNNAFYQTASGSGSNALTTVTFPEGLTTLTIGSYAFYQTTSGSGSNALTTVTFPEGLTTLTIGSYAFYQNAGGSNALTTVAFPDSLTTLTIGSYAFYQNAGGSNALTTVTFPESMTTLTIGYYAFYQTASGSGSNALTTVAFPGLSIGLCMGVVTLLVIGICLYGLGKRPRVGRGLVSSS